jgi:hypothetical protein
MDSGYSFAIHLHPGKDLPALPPTGLKSTDDARRLKVVAEIDAAGKMVFAPGPSPSIYAYARTTKEISFEFPLN